MNSKELIKRVIEHDNPPRIGYNFNSPSESDLAIGYGIFKLRENPDKKYADWGLYPEIKNLVPDFKGEVCLYIGNVLGRLNEKTKGECIYGALENSWDGLDKYIEKYLLPLHEKEKYDLAALEKWFDESHGKFTVLPVHSLQSTARDARKMENMLMDTVLETDNLKTLVSACADAACKQVDILAQYGVDAAVIYDDWGLQHSLYLSPDSWRDIWKNEYKKVAVACHNHGMKFMLHSCGNIAELFDDFIEIGIDVLQLDQPALFGYEELSARLKGKITVWSPVDIQKFLPTGNKELIQAEAASMIKHLHKNGGFIAKDYPTLEDIDVKDEWAQFARDIFTA